MSKEEFMRELERLLVNVPDNERIEALNYYEEYFSDAGEENWQKVIEELESPAKVAETIKDTFYQNTAPTSEKEGMPAWAIVLIVLGCIFLSPVILGLAGTIFGVLAAIFFSCLGLIIGFGGAGIGLIIGGLVMTVMGIADMFFTPMAGMLLSGTGLILLAVGILFIMLTVWLCGWAIPALCRGIAGLFKKALKKSK